MKTALILIYCFGFGASVIAMVASPRCQNVDTWRRVAQPFFWPITAAVFIALETTDGNVNLSLCEVYGDGETRIENAPGT